MEIDWSVEALEHCSLVRVQLSHSSPVPRRIRLENRLDGPLAPPRRRGVPESGWDETGYEGTVPANGRLAIGYACPASVRHPPVELTRDEPVPDPDDAMSECDTSPEAIRRRLGSGAPPRDAVPSDSIDPQGDAEAESTSGGELLSETEPTSEAELTPSTPALPAVPRVTTQTRSRSASTAETSSDGAESSGVDERNRTFGSPVPDAVDDWLDEVERRADHADALTGASVSAATQTLAEIGGLDAAESLPTRLAGDAEALRALAERAEALACRAESTDVPVDALESLA